MSTQLVGDLYLIPLDHARKLCRDNSPTTSSPKDRVGVTPDDFYTFGGFCSWRPGQLEMEMGTERDEWVALSVDGRSILEQLRRLRDAEGLPTQPPLQEEPPTASHCMDAGTKMWGNFLNLVGRTESIATRRLPVGQLEFYDQMLHVWAEENLMIVDPFRSLSESATDASEEKRNGNVRDAETLKDGSNRNDTVEPGTLVRATLTVPNDTLLFDQEFVKSLVLVLEETPEATVGLLLNHPLGASVELLEGKSPLPLRYGGAVDFNEWKEGGMYEEDESDDAISTGNDQVDSDMYEGFMEYQNEPPPEFDFGGIDGSDEDDDDDDYSPFIWLHRSASLGSRGPSNGGGSPLGKSGVYQIRDSDVVEALQTGLLNQEDVMVFSGVCIWEKSPDLGNNGGGLREQIETLRTFEAVPTGLDERQMIGSAVWNILGRQHVLTKDSLDDNIHASMDAWSATRGTDFGSILRRKDVTVPPTAAISSIRSSSSMKREILSDAALRGWLGVNLLGDPLETLVSVPKI
eukprot:CAMPEP_0194414884 /NCGR_PEP_ID=MMETSP0176-20130528/13668_1 /TAXON_ID=216777 /ORGANISM="Proboscia alata, Strain PI-D3" /LENGTH=517 /DNA_ID=CAMNT_0039219245 /DNA_START=227 /DNA_END=1780 /DNA_ORIENTATION=+